MSKHARVADLLTATREVAKQRPTKQEQLAKLIVELGLDAAEIVFQQVRAKLEKIA